MKSTSTKPSVGTWYQICASVTGNLIALSDGMTIGWTSPMIPYFLSDRSHLKVTRHEVEMMETYLLIGGLLGVPVTIYLVDKIGRKKSLLVAAAALLLGWIVIAFANRIEYIYAARVLAGMGGDMSFVASPMYIAEIASKSIRGFLTSIIYLMSLTGIILVYLLGWYCPYYVPSLVAGVFLLLELIIFSFFPESPYYLLQKSKHKEAKASLSKFRSGKKIDEEFMEMAQVIEKKNQEDNKFQIKDIFLMKNYRKSLLIMAVLNANQHLSGIYVIVMNMHDILATAGSIYMDSSTAAIAFAIMMFITAIIASVTVDKFGRKKLLIISGSLTGLCLLTVAIYFHVKDLGVNYESISWLPLFSLLTYGLVFKYGIGLVPIVITGEIFDSKFKALGMALAECAYTIAAIISIQIYNILRDTVGIYVPFYLFSCCAFIAVVFVILFVPETKGRSLDDIQAILKGEYKHKNELEVQQ